MKIREIGKALLVSGAVMAFWGAAPGCGPSAGSYCNKVCDCTACSESERTDCIDTVNDARDVSGDQGCESEFEAYFSCVNGVTTCVDDEAEADGCEAEADALAKCGGPVVLGGNPCRRYVEHLFAKYAECGIDIGGGEVVEDECSPENAKFSLCLDPCIAELTCDYINNPESDPAANQAYNDCVITCL